MRKNNPSKLHRQFLRQSPETILYFVDRYEEVIKKRLHKSYKGRLEEKWKDLEALYNEIFKKTPRIHFSDPECRHPVEVSSAVDEPELTAPKLHKPSLKDLKYMSKRTLATLFFATAQDLRLTEIKRLDSYWRKRREAREELIAGKRMSRKEFKEKLALAEEYWEMIKKSRKVVIERTKQTVTSIDIKENS